ncbi:aldehyde dehydrogenase [Aspergillus japonicus CBS 114.51]|uniref:aldehyde dehydrogenase (NAD(+)) n=2 Tax=Aspergillus TaxID=5052 RepID=A0A2V5HL70_ASPV1|nr:aldehyde dehydrogenase [Aspergillus japonicus CBS 114.51]PYI22213.1 aldehyde dehydrogenase [Aspergillus violaceofuscus CBS 115571]RAH82720.1 aldehyde dehydrogenase [Aspergillus japonicus CBS 114.51]
MFSNIIRSEQRHGGDTVTVTDPRTLTELWPVPMATENDLDEAVQAAREAFPIWKARPLEDRQQCLHRMADELETRQDELRPILAKESGRSDVLAKIEIDDALRKQRLYFSFSLSLSVEYEDESVRIVFTYPPLGVVGAICPWNFPLVLEVGKGLAALVMGNCVIVKPSPMTPYATLKFVEYTLDIRVLQALNESNEVGARMTTHPDIDKISFTGSTATGRRIAESAGRSLKRVTLELGGNDASIVCADIDVNEVAARVAQGCFFHAGQMCVATKRVYVHRDVLPQFRSAFIAAVQKIVIDRAAEHSPLFSPLQNRMQYQIVQDFLADSAKQVHTFSVGGPERDGKPLPGLYISPTVVDRPPDNARIVQEEQFGPVIPILEWSDEAELIRRVNATESGLGACVWALDVATAERIARQLEVGTVWLNSFANPHPHGYFSGWKQSGIGGEWGRQGLLS